LCAHLLAGLVAPCRRTIANLICVCGRAQADWTADYRLYSRERVDPTLLFRHALREVEAQLRPQAPLVIALDDTLVRKSGPHIFGVGYKRDPLGPAFQTNLVRGQRFLQLAAAWPGPDGQAQMIPIDFTHAPTPKKPGQRATAAQRQVYKEQQKQQRLNAVAGARLNHLRSLVEAARRLIFCGDGGYTNAEIVGHLPPNTVYIGRIRKDAVLHALPGAPGPTGRPASYGPEVSTPEQLRTDPSVLCQTIRGWAAGRRHEFKVKTFTAPVLWRKSGADRPLRVVVIAPIGYRLRQGSRLLYRQPAFLICTDPDLPLEELLQAYLWRWGIEVAFRDEKSLLGTGEAQVRGPAATRTQPAVTVAAYAFLWIAALKMMTGGAPPATLQPPRWRRRPKDAPPSTGDLLRALRCELWAPQIDPESFSHFTSAMPVDATTQKPDPSLAHAILAAA
jgi:hypothetical protein